MPDESQTQNHYSAPGAGPGEGKEGRSRARDYLFAFLICPIIGSVGAGAADVLGNVPYSFVLNSEINRNLSFSSFLSGVIVGGPAGLVAGMIMIFLSQGLIVSRVTHRITAILFGVFTAINGLTFLAFGTLTLGPLEYLWLAGTTALSFIPGYFAGMAIARGTVWARDRS